MSMKSRIAILTLAVLVSLLINSCKVGSNYVKPEIDVPDKYLNGGEYQYNPLHDSSWWGVFNDPDLTKLIDQALEKNQDLKIAMESVEQSRLYLNIQKAELLPNINGELNGIRGNFLGSKSENVVSNYYAVGSVNWEIDLWGKIRRLKESALADYMATEYGLKSVRLALIAEVASTYFIFKEFESPI